MNAPDANTNLPAIKMSGVSAGAPGNLDITVLEDVNWSVSAGEYWVVGGMHDSGKTSLLWLAAGLTPPQKGSYQLFGETMPNFNDEARNHRLRIGLVFDGGQAFHRLTVLENIELPLRYHGTETGTNAAQRAREILELTELGRWPGRLPGSLGRAWEKRVGLARALVLQPDVLLLDNPIGGLDIRHANWWIRFLGELSAGHACAGKRPMTLVVTAENLRPWRNQTVCVGILQDRRFRSLGCKTKLFSIDEPLVREFLREEEHTPS